MEKEIYCILWKKHLKSLVPLIYKDRGYRCVEYEVDVMNKD